MFKRAKRAQPLGWSRDPKLREPNANAIGRAAVRARSELAQVTPLQSAKTPAGRVFVVLMMCLAVANLLGAFGLAYFSAIWIITSFAFALLGILRAVACLCPVNLEPELVDNATPEAAPPWTILIALYNEADSVPSLLAALSQLEWAPDQLDIIFACERDDTATLRMLFIHQHKCNFRIIRVPAGGPRTKPNALQTALPFARGRYLTVYDAEDRPHPKQLRAAFQAFVTAPPNLAVVQAPLITWNHSESWIARQFALDYAIWFRVMLPAFACVSGLIPLGGTSNHFRTEILRQVGGWDPYNVTEDADLGVRLYRNGFKAGLISPPTYEEAPPRVSAWVKQRGRWIQGHIQTFSLHLRSPSALLNDIGWKGLLAFLIGLGIGPMSALIVLPFMVGVIAALGSNFDSGAWIPLVLGTFGHLIAAYRACQRDGRWRLLTSVVTLPLYYCLQTVAACRAMWRVVFTPSIWDKTDHGCAARAPIDKGGAQWIGQQLS